jgi:hypothetical protein
MGFELSKKKFTKKNKGCVTNFKKNDDLHKEQSKKKKYQEH